jgi:hypothetical protein
VYEIALPDDPQGRTAAVHEREVPEDLRPLIAAVSERGRVEKRR